MAKDYIDITNVEECPVSKEIQIIKFAIDKVTLYAIYRTGNSKANHATTTGWLERELNKQGNRPYVITGDMNLPELAIVEFDPKLVPVGSETPNGLQVKTYKHMWTNLVKKHALDQHVETATHIGGGILDYVFAPDHVDIPSINVNRGSFGSGFDHYAVVFEIDSYHQKTKKENYSRKETNATWKKFHENMPSQREIMNSMPDYRSNLSGRELTDKISSYITGVLTKVYEDATPLTKSRPKPAGGFLTKNTIRHIAHAKRLYRKIVKTQEDEKKPYIREKLRLLNRSIRWMIRKDREAWELRRLHLSSKRGLDFYRFMNGITQKTKTLGPILTPDGKLRSSDKDMSPSFNDYLCDLMPPSTRHNINWDIKHESKESQLYIAAIPGSHHLKPLDNDEILTHIVKLQNALKDHGYVLEAGDIADGYPLGQQPRGQKGLPIVITYKDKKTKEDVEAASKKAGLWNKRKYRDNNTDPDTIIRGFFTEAYDTLNVIHISTDEIREAIRQSKRSSAAGPDGLRMSVYSEACEYLLGPLQILYNTINSTGQVPANFKTAKVILLHKKNSKQEMGNYRPISMSNHISKIWERVFNTRLMTHLGRHNRLSRQQHGFRPKMGCHTNLIESWERGVDLADKHGPKMEFWSFDLQKAFDMLDHGKVLTLCHRAGINGFVGKSLEDWLTSRTQFVQCGKETSNARIVNRSCVQGSVLGPTLWLIYIQSLLDRLEDKCDYFAYADDVTIIAKISSKKEIEDFHKILQTLLDWGQDYSMKWGAHKTQRMAIRYPKCGGKKPPMIIFDGKVIEPSDTLETLGVLLNKGCIGYAQMEKIRQKIRAMRTLISKNYRIRTQEILERLYTTYVQPQLNYCSQQWNTNNESHLKGIENEIRLFWKLCQTKLRPSHIMGLREQMIYNDLKLLHQMKLNKSPIVFEEFFSISKKQKDTGEKIEKKAFKHSFAQHTFGHRLQKYWNWLPLKTRNMSQEMFKLELKTIFTSQCKRRLRQKQALLNLGMDMPITLPPPSIYEQL